MRLVGHVLLARPATRRVFTDHISFVFTHFNPALFAAPVSKFYLCCLCRARTSLASRSSSRWPNHATGSKKNSAFYKRSITGRVSISLTLILSFTTGRGVISHAHGPNVGHCGVGHAGRQGRIILKKPARNYIFTSTICNQIISCQVRPGS